MNQTLKIVLIVGGVLIVGAGLLTAGVLIGRSSWGMAGFWPGRGMIANAPNLPEQFEGWAGPGGRAGRMWSERWRRPGGDETPFGYGRRGAGTMDGWRGGMGRGGMMGGLPWGSGLSDVKPLSIDQARQAVETYLTGLNNADLKVGEIMIFDNHAYAEVVESSTGIGAMEVLVDPVTLAVHPESGPNRMWNLKYSPMPALAGRMGMMSPGFTTPPEPTAEMPVTAAQALESAQKYLDAYLPGGQAGEAEPFYGYYTLHILRDGGVVGMLSVNGYTRQVFPHTWHGKFIEKSGE